MGTRKHVIDLKMNQLVNLPAGFIVERVYRRNLWGSVAEAVVLDSLRLPKDLPNLKSLYRGLLVIDAQYEWLRAIEVHRIDLAQALQITPSKSQRFYQMIDRISKDRAESLRSQSLLDIFGVDYGIKQHTS
jgi:hypothetical protein